MATQHNLRRLAERAAQSGLTGRHHSVMPPAAVAPPVGAIRNRRATRLTATQRNGIGRRSEWRLSPYMPRGGWR